jgi:hypothetical protein
MNLKPVDRFSASDGTEIVAGLPDGDVTALAKRIQCASVPNRAPRLRYDLR